MTNQTQSAPVSIELRDDEHAERLRARFPRAFVTVVMCAAPYGRDRIAFESGEYYEGAEALDWIAAAVGPRPGHAG